MFFFFSSRRWHTRCYRDWSSDVCSSDLAPGQRVRPKVITGVSLPVGIGTSRHRDEVAVMAGKRVLVIGGNFGGLTAALELKHELGDEVDVTVVSASDRFLFNPSLIWLPFGKRDAAHITFPLAPTFDAHGIGFVHAQATAIDPAARTVATTGGSYGYDYLVVATGFRNKFDIVPGLGPDGYAQTITTLADAERAGTAWRRFLDDPGPVVIGATQGASCFGAAYEFLFNTARQLRKAKLHNKVPLTF